MFTGLEMMACPNLAVPAEVMQHVVQVESGANPYAIGVVGGQLVRQPRDLDEALATVRMLDDKGYNYSVGVAQVNRANLQKYGLNSYRQAFVPCANLAAGSQILAQCFASAGGDWGKSFSCYYSGNFTTGYRDGYVQKVFDSIGRAKSPTGAPAIPLQTPEGPHPATDPGAVAAYGGPAYRVAIRSATFDRVASSLISAGATRIQAGVSRATPVTSTTALAASASPGTDPVSGSDAGTTQFPVATAISTAMTTSTESVFRPGVRGPGEQNAAASSAPEQTVLATAWDAATTPLHPPDHADLRKDANDAAFVF